MEATDDLMNVPEKLEKNTEPIVQESPVENKETRRSEDAEENRGNDCPEVFNDANAPEAIIFTGNASDSDESDDEKFGATRKKRAKGVRVRIESDSDPDEDNEEQKEADDDKNANSLEPVKKSKKISNLIDSESSEEENEADDDKNPKSPEAVKKSKKISNLIDSESEEDESQQQNSPSAEISLENEASPMKKEKSRKSGKNLSKRAAKSEAMNKIYSETQRLIRESSVSLPYHRPKQRTLEEFLNRKKIAPALPKASTMAAKVKISATIVSKALEEKEKEAETFYVELSESDGEPDHSTAIPKISVPSPVLEESCIEETQKLQKMNIQQRQNMIHNGSLEFAVSRKLFLEETPIPVAEEPISKSPVEGISQENEKKVQKEFKRDLKDVSCPRKLFSPDFEEGAETVGHDCHQLETISVDNSNSEAAEAPEVPKSRGEIEKSEDEDNIYETPMISNKELARVNQRSIPSESQDDPEEEEGDCGVIGLPPPEIIAKERIRDSDFVEKSVNNPTSVKKNALLNVKNSKPKIRGNPGMMIDLTESSKPNKSAINNLMDRFLMKHATISKPEEKSAEITVLNTELTSDGFKISKDTLSYKLKPEVVDDNELNKPGAKLKRLKEELQKRMASKRNEEWKQKEKEMVTEEEEDEEFEPDEKDMKNLDEESEGESEPEVDDIVIKDKKSKNHYFCDDEAEVSDEELLGLSGDEDDEEDDGDDEEEEDETEKSKKFTRIIEVNEDSNSGDEDIESGLSKETFSRKNTDVDIFSDEDEVMASQKSQNPEKLENLKSKLFEDEVSPVNEDELLELCSGKFPDSQNQTQNPDLGGLINSPSSEGITDSQLMNLCSGSFPTQLRSSEVAEDAANVEKCKNPQESSKSTEDPENWNLRIVSSSDSENEPENLEKNKKKKKLKKLVLSDDEDEEMEKYSEEESEIEMEVEEEKFIDYDSEENEVIVVEKKDIKKVAANFLEEEAELSESEWGSDDEDERNLDNYELEEADNEEIDENKMRDQIGRIHARQVLDEDNRDVRMLKELLFDDGDLHEDGGGRERKFRWKNIDKVGIDSGTLNDEEDDEIEEENYDPVKELEWRKLRLEKQKFLEEKKKTEANEIYSDLGDGEIIKLGMRILKKSSESANALEADANELGKKRSIVPRSVSELVQCSSNSSNRLNNVIKRGSFLARGDQALAKLAVMIKQTDTLPLAPKNTGNFVFTHLSPSVEGLRTEEGELDETQEETSAKDTSRKRKSTPMTPRTSKKPKIQVQKF